MDNTYDNYLEQKHIIVNNSNRVSIIFDVATDLSGSLNSICKIDKDTTSFVFSFSIGTGVMYYFGIKPSKIIINNDSNRLSITAEEFLISSIDVDRKLNRYIMTIEAKNEKYIRN